MIRNWHTFIFVVLFLALQAVVSAQSSGEKAFFETGEVRAPAVKGEINAYPVVSRTASGKIFIAWSQSVPNNRDGKIMGAVSRDNGRTWGEAFLVLDIPNKFDGDPCVIIDEKRILVYASSVIPPNKINKSDIWLASSEDDGKTWSMPAEIKTPFNYFVGKRHIGLKLKDGTLVMPASYDLWAQAGGIPAKTEGEMDLKAGVMLSKDGINWTPHVELHLFAPKVTPFSTGGVVEPAIVELDNGELYMLLRTGTERLYESRSKDGGKNWSKPVPSPLYGHNTPASLWRLDRNPKEIIAIWNNSPRNRYPLSVSISANGGKKWSMPKDVAKSDGLQISYPGITQDKEGNFIAVWQEQLPTGQGRTVRWARFNRAWVLSD